MTEIANTELPSAASWLLYTTSLHNTVTKSFSSAIFYQSEILSHTGFISLQNQTKNSKMVLMLHNQVY